MVVVVVVVLGTVLPLIQGRKGAGQTPPTARVQMLFGCLQCPDVPVAQELQSWRFLVPPHSAVAVAVDVAVVAEVPLAVLVSVAVAVVVAVLDGVVVCDAVAVVDAVAVAVAVCDDVAVVVDVCVVVAVVVAVLVCDDVAVVVGVVGAKQCSNWMGHLPVLFKPTQMSLAC